MINYFFNFITGLLLFFFGINTLNTIFNSNNTDYLKDIINKNTSTFKGLLTGIITTIITQSSSFITVIIQSLVDHNILSLYESTSIIMGANIGTCSSTFFIIILLSFNINIFNNSLLIGILSIICFIFLLKKHKLFSLFIGITIILLSMNIMSDSTNFIINSNNFTELLKYLENPILGLLIGIILTSILQSSSLITCILSSISLSISIPYLSAINIILGSNIGTCSTVILASINGSKNAKKVSIIHLLFNMLGSVIFLIILYFMNYIYPLKFLNNFIKPLDIAFIHLTFNVFTTIIFLPLRSKLIKLCNYLIK